MSYNDLKDRLGFLNTKIEIVDIDEYNKYFSCWKSGQPLPDNITYKTIYSNTDEEDVIFYREATDEEIKVMIEISNARSLKRTGDALHFFKVLTIISLLLTFGIFFIGLIIATF